MKFQSPLFLTIVTGSMGKGIRNSDFTPGDVGEWSYPNPGTLEEFVF